MNFSGCNPLKKSTFPNGGEICLTSSSAFRYDSGLIIMGLRWYRRAAPGTICTHAGASAHMLRKRKPWPRRNARRRKRVRNWQPRRSRPANSLARCSIANSRSSRSSSAICIKYFFDVSQAEQERRFLARAADPLRYWKLNQIDYKTLPFTPPEAGKRKKRQPGTPESLTFHHEVPQIY